jgi:carboxypeptidase C (cathepsin A)
MNELERLKKLLHHWIEHNDEHAEAYLEWSKKASSLGKKELSNRLEKISVEAKKLNELFIKAIKTI